MPSGKSGKTRRSEAAGQGRFWKGRNVFVTGASGLLGSWLTQRLIAEKAHVTILMRDCVPDSLLCYSGTIGATTVVRADLEDYWSLERSLNEYEIDTVFHLGAQAIVGTAHRSPLPTFEANVRGTYNLLEACRVHSKSVQRVVVASSDKAYGEQKELPCVEEMALQGRQPYAVSKSCADLLAQCYAHTYGLQVVILRCGNIFGGGDRNWSRIVPGTIRSLLRRERPVIRSDGKLLRDYIYVKDVVSAYLRAAEALDDPRVAGEAFNVSNEKPLSVLTLVREIQRLMGCAAIEPDIQNIAAGEILNQYLSARKAHELLAWKTEYTLDSALEETIEWYRQFLSERGQ